MNIAELTLTLHNNTLNPIRRIAKESSISTSQLLCIVSIPTNGINQTNLAALLSIDLSTLSRNLKHLIHKEVIIKKVNQFDSRSYKILLTNNGEILRNKLFEKLELYLNDLHLFLNDNDIEKLLDSLSNFNWLLLKKNLDNAPI